MIFQFTSKKIISLLACISITISCLVIPVSAAVTPGQVIEGIGTISTLWDIGKDAYEMWQELNPDKDPSEYPGFNPGGSFSGAGGSRDDAIARYEEYVNGLQTDLGTTALIDGGVRIYFDYAENGLGAETGMDLVSRVGGIEPMATYVHASSGKSKDFTLYGYEVGRVQPIKAPFAATCKTGFYHVNNFGAESTWINDPAYDCAAGKTIYPRQASWTCGSEYYGSTVFVKASQWVDFVPLSGAVLPTTQDITINSRPTSIVGDYGIMGEDGSIVKVEGGSLVNESENLVYSPTTAGEITYTDCVFDYADRSYTLTLEDGSTMKVVYGDENVTIEEGDTIYNVYYLSSDSGSGGSGSDGGGSGDGSVGGAVSGFLGALGDVISGLISGLLSLATKALEALTGLGDLLKQLGESLIGFFSGFTDFLGAVFPFLPEETFAILNLGLILMIAAAVFKKFF